MGETIIVILIVAAVAVLAGRSLYRTITGKSKGCGCGQGGCSVSGDCPGFSQRTKSVKDERHMDPAPEGSALE